MCGVKSSGMKNGMESGGLEGSGLKRESESSGLESCEMKKIGMKKIGMLSGRNVAIVRIWRRAVCTLLVAGMVLQGMPVTVMAEGKDAQKETITIKTAEDLYAFAQACKNADYSVGREVVLSANVNLEELPEDKVFEGIASFSGTFRGYFHTISGIHFTEGGEAQGLFCYLERGAKVQDLTVKGTIDCSESKVVVGGIAGINAGTIQGCYFKGTVSSLGETGGIVGKNGGTGSVVRCNVSGAINGLHKVGGVAGENRGVITDCNNAATVNADTRWLDFEDEEDLSLTAAGIWSGLQEKIEEGTDFGGIAGWNGGIIAGCSNKAVVGYQHAGKNVGGIAGRSSGQIIRSVNTGRIYGKTDVGGIAGQFEPKTAIQDTEELGEKVTELHDLMDQMIRDMEKMGDDLHGDFQDISGQAREAGNTADALLTEMRDVVEKNVEVVNELARRIDYCMTHFGTVMRYLNQALNSGDALLDDMDQLKEDLDLEEQMEEDDYDAAKRKRLVLQAGVGGVLVSDNANPAEGNQVTITIKEQTGYQLSKLILTPYGKEAQDVTATVTNDTYVIDSMPAENVTLDALFTFAGAYALESNAGGKAILDEDQTKLKLEALPGYVIQSVTIDGGANLYAGETEMTLPSPVGTGKMQTVAVTFAEESGAHLVHVTSGTGGTITADPAMANAGETVSLNFTTLSGYEPDAGSFHVRDANGNEIPFQTGLSYTFVMPEGDAFVEGTFSYAPTDSTRVYAVSNPGGRVTTFTNPTTSNTQVTISCDSGYEALSMKVTDSATPTASTYIIPASEMNKNESTGVYTYELSASTLTDPVKVEVTFGKKAETYYAVKTVSGVGGTLYVDKATVTGGDTLRIFVPNETTYVLSSLRIQGGEDLSGQVEDHVYEYEVPAAINGDLEIEATFRPVKLVIQSETVSGTGTFAVADGNVEFTIVPDAGFYLSGCELKKEDGSSVSVQKQYADSEVYQFPAAELADQTGWLNITFQRQSNKDAVKDAKDNLENQTDNIVDGVDNISNVSDRIKELMTDEYGENKNPEDLTQDEIRELSDLLVELMGYVADTGVAAGYVVGDIGTIAKVTGPYAEEAMDNARDDLDQISEDAHAMSDSLQAAGKELQGIVDYLNALEKLRAVNLSSQFDRNSEKLKTDLDTVADLLDRLDDHAYFHSEKLENDMRAVNDKMNEVLTLLVEKMDNMESLASGEDVIEDLSAQDPESLDAARISLCTNKGCVNGDQNAGGIAGTMDVERTENEQQKKISMGSKYNARAVLLDSENEGFVTVKNENGGGIVGNLEIGYVRGCLGSGRIQGEEANCLGGIAGKSLGTIVSCSSLAVLDGNNYIGGIAGKASAIQNCYSMATVLGAKEWVGAIAGKEAYDDEEEDASLLRSLTKEKMTGNYYCSSSLYGINGVSYAGAAQAVTYGELLAMEGVPQAFGELSVTFLDADQNLIQKTVLPYGTKLSALEYPELKTQSGEYMEWEGLIGTVLEGNLVLQASEMTNVTILSGLQQGKEKPVALAEGTFTEEAKIQIEDYVGKTPEEAPVGSICHFYKVTLENTSLGEDAVTRVRLLREEEGDATVYRLDNGKWVKAKSKTLGSYEETEMHGTEAIFCVSTLKKEINWGMIIVIAVMTVVILVLLAVILKLIKKQKKQKEQRRQRKEFWEDVDETDEIE